jgi:TetR/AcrR family transcriptional regulator, transcriptional repressor for nem operon
MRASKAEAERSRERIIEVASKLFRERGFDGIGVADLMKAAGLTHGGFYRHFTSKEDLMAQATAHALDRGRDALRQWADGDGGKNLSAIAAAYLSVAHRDRPGEGCALAALGADAARHGSPVQETFTAAVRSAVDILASLTPGKTERARRERALVAYAGMVGALVLARAVDDPELSGEVLNAVRTSIAGGNSPAPDSRSE